MRKPTFTEVIVRTKSHRARERLDRAIGRHPLYYFTWTDGGCFAEITAEEYETIKSVKGITRARVSREDLRMCWS